MTKIFNKKIKVAIVYHCIAHYREPIFRSLCEQNGDIEYTLVSGKSDHTPSLNTVDIKKTKLPVANGGLRWRLVRNTWFGEKLLWQSGLIKLAVSREFDVIIYLGVVYHISTWVSCTLARLCGKRTLMWSHGFLRKESGVKGMVRGVFYGLCDGMLLYHHRARNILIDKGFNPDKLDVLYNSLDVTTQIKVRQAITEKTRSKVKENLAMANEIPILLWVGRLTAHKKLTMIFDAICRLNEQGLEVGLILVGDGPERVKLENEVLNRNIQKQIKFYGACHNEAELGPIISAADLCVAPGEVGLTCMHSLVYGTPVITHDNPDYQMPEYEAIREGITGSFFKYEDIDDLARVIYEWLNSKISRNEIRERCYEVIDKYYNPNVQVRIIGNAVSGNPSFLVGS